MSTHKQSRRLWVTVFSHNLSLRATVQLGGLCACLGLPCVCVCVRLWGRGRWGRGVAIGGQFMLDVMSDSLHKWLVWWPEGTATPLCTLSISPIQSFTCNTKRFHLNISFHAFQMSVVDLHPCFPDYDDVLDVPQPWSSQSVLTAYYKHCQPLMQSFTHTQTHRKPPISWHHRHTHMCKHLAPLVITVSIHKGKILPHLWWKNIQHQYIQYITGVQLWRASQ